MMKLDKFTRSYIETALWSSTFPEEGDDGRWRDIPMDRDFDVSDVHPETLAKMVKECRDFQDDAVFCDAMDDGAIGSLETAGHDFWLTRNHHGAGFWDGDYPAPWDRKLTALSHSFGEVSLYLGDENPAVRQY